MAEHNKKGLNAEEIAVKYLQEKNYTIRERNWRHYHKEIDIIAEKENRIIIVEVKSTSEIREENASELFSLKKMKNMVEAAEAYVIKENLMKEIRFDFFLVIFGSEKYTMRHIPDAFIPGVNW